MTQASSEVERLNTRRSQIGFLHPAETGAPGGPYQPDAKSIAHPGPGAQPVSSVGGIEAGPAAGQWERNPGGPQGACQVQPMGATVPSEHSLADYSGDRLGKELVQEGSCET